MNYEEEIERLRLEHKAANKRGDLEERDRIGKEMIYLISKHQVEEMSERIRRGERGGL
jgi:hypothetical protein